MTIQGRFDGKGIVLDQTPPADWWLNMPVTVIPVNAASAELCPDASDGATEAKPAEASTAMLAIAARARDLGLPPDFSEQHDHYIHGTPKR